MQVFDSDGNAQLSIHPRSAAWAQPYPGDRLGSMIQKFVCQRRLGQAA
jgi:hypothetical protein